MEDLRRVGHSKPPDNEGGGCLGAELSRVRRKVMTTLQAFNCGFWISRTKKKTGILSSSICSHYYIVDEVVGRHAQFPVA